MAKQVFCTLAVFMIFLSMPAFAGDVNWSGYFGTSYEDDTSEGRSGAFDTHIISLISNIRVSDNLRIVAQIDWEHAPFIDAPGESDSSMESDRQSYGDISVSNAYAQYEFADYFRINAGKFLAPVGMYNQLLHAVPSYPTLEIPLASVDKDSIFFERYLQGVSFTGNYAISDKVGLSYDLFLTNGKSAELNVDENQNKNTGGRISINYSVTDTITLKPVLSFYTDEFNADTSSSPLWMSQTSLLPGFELQRGDLVVRFEYADSTIDNITGSGSMDLSAFYTEMYYTFSEKYTPFLRYEMLDPDSGVSNNKETVISMGVAYHIELWQALLKLQVKFNDFEDTSEDSYRGFGIGLSLGF